MIINKKTEVKIYKWNIDYYSTFVSDIKMKDTIEIETEKLQRGSNIKIQVKCDKCGDEKTVKFYCYILNVENWNCFSCSKCSNKNKIEKSKKTKKDRYGDENYYNLEKSKKTNLEKYGVENVSQLKEIKDKKTKTNLKNWGVENVFQSVEIKKVSNKTKKEKYGDEHFTNREKSKKTCLINNGVEWPTQSNEVLKTRNLNNKTKWGVEHYNQTEECQDRIKNTCLEKYGKESYLATDICQIKSRKTCNEKYGVDYPSQNLEIHKKQFPKMKTHEIGIKYQGSYEKDFLELCQKLNLNVSRGKTINFTFKNKNKIYFSDYYLEDYNLIIEIKSMYIYELNEELNIVKKTSVLEQGYNFMFIIDKKYDDFLLIMNIKL